MQNKRWVLTLFILMILSFSQTQALAGLYSGNDLVVLMREYERADTGASRVNWVKAREYGAYIIGVYDATEFLYNIPDRVTIGQIAAVVSKYLKNHPEKWGKPAALLVIEALQTAFLWKNRSDQLSNKSTRYNHQFAPLPG